MYLKLKTAAMHEFWLNGLDTAQTDIALEGFNPVVLWIGCLRVLKARSKNLEKQYPFLRQMQQNWSPENSVKPFYTA